VIAGYLRAVAAGDARALQGYVWRYAEASAGQPPLQKGEVQGRLATVESQGGFGAGGLWVEAYRAELVPGGPLFFTLAREPGDKSPRVAAVSREPVNIHSGDAGPIEAGWQEDAEKAVRGYFEALERRDFEGAVRWVHPAWHDFTAMRRAILPHNTYRVTANLSKQNCSSPERELRSLRLIAVKPCAVYRVGRVVLIEYEVEVWARYPGLFTRQPYPRSRGRNIYFVMLTPLDPSVPAAWRIVCIGSGP